MSNKHYRSHWKHFLLPALVFGAISGVLSGLVVTLYKFLAGKLIHLSEEAYHFMRANLWWVIAGIAVMAFAAFVYHWVLTRIPDAKGGGIPTAVGLLRGIFTFRPAASGIGVFVLSLLSFLLGVPLGNEGPSVQMGAACGKLTADSLGKKHPAWSRYAMTGGACAGFNVATGAPLSGILFAIEEGHQSVSPMIVLVASVAVLCSSIVSSLLSPILGVDPKLFHLTGLETLQTAQLWLPLVIGAVLGLFAVAFLKYYQLIHHITEKYFTKLPYYFRILLILLLTLTAGLICYDCISTGHHLSASLFDSNRGVMILLGIMVVRSTLTLLANTNGVTGGIFLPIISLGALFAAILGRILIEFGMSENLLAVTLALGICGCISGMMKMPLTAIFFAAEALGCWNNLLPVILTAAVSYCIPQVLDYESITDEVLEGRIKSMYQDKTPTVADIHVHVQSNAFAVGMHMRDILWPHNMMILSIRRENRSVPMVDAQGQKQLRPGDTLHLRYCSLTPEETLNEIFAIVGPQTLGENIEFQQKEAL